MGGGGGGGGGFGQKRESPDFRFPQGCDTPLD